MLQRRCVRVLGLAAGVAAIAAGGSDGVLESVGTGEGVAALLGPVEEPLPAPAIPLAPSDQLGYSVAIDGDIAVVGANQDGTKGVYAGAAYAYVRSGGS